MTNWNIETTIKRFNKYENALKDLGKSDTILPNQSTIILQELIDKDTNGIYISKEQASELLEALEKIGKQEDLYGRSMIKEYMNLKDDYNKLYKALDWRKIQ